MTNAALRTQICRRVGDEREPEPAVTTNDLDERASLYEQASRMMLDDAALIPLYSNVEVLGTRGEVQGFRVAPQGHWDFADTFIEEG